MPDDINELVKAASQFAIKQNSSTGSSESQKNDVVKTGNVNETWRKTFEEIARRDIWRFETTWELQLDHLLLITLTHISTEDETRTTHLKYQQR